jgi:hypothetical protein
LIIELKRTMTPEDMGATECCICGDTFELATVTAWTLTDEEGRYGVGDPDPWACPACVEVLGAYRPDRFPTIAEYKRLERRWPTPEYGSGEAADAAGKSRKA